MKGLDFYQFVLIRSKLSLIDNHTLQVPVAWVQNQECTDEIIGRLIVFDYFNVEFRQSEEKIIFTPVNEDTHHEIHHS